MLSKAIRAQHNPRGTGTVVPSFFLAAHRASSLGILTFCRHNLRAAEFFEALQAKQPVFEGRRYPSTFPFPRICIILQVRIMNKLFGQQLSEL